MQESLPFVAANAVVRGSNKSDSPSTVLSPLKRASEHFGQAVLKIEELRKDDSFEQSVPMSVHHAGLRSGGKFIKQNSALGRFIFHPRFESFGGCVVLLNFVVMTMETNAGATNDQEVKDLVKILNRIFLMYYILESSARMWVMRRKYFHTVWNNLDLVIIITGLLSEVLEVFDVGGSGMDQIGMLKSLRLLRMLRLVRLLVAFRELYVLVAGIGRCMKTLFWAGGLIFLVLNAWAILSVELLDSKVKALELDGAFGTCSWCATAFSNIWYANLTWFQIISTADWSPIGRPLAEKYYWPYLFFVFNVFAVMWGLLNLIVAAILDANIAARENDVAIAAKLAEQAHASAWKSFAELCKAMDEDHSGDISVAEFKKFWSNNLELQQHLTIMGVQEKDVDELLNLMDEDGSGMLESQEFIEQFTLMRTLVEKSTIFFILKFVQSIQNRLIQQSIHVRNLCADLADVKRATLQAAPPQTDDAYSPTPRVTTKAPSALKGSNMNAANLGVSLEVPIGDKKTLPAGWYYFGASLPTEASVWCKAMDPSCEAVHLSKLQPDDKELPRLPRRTTKGVTITTESPKWEPVPTHGVHLREANDTFDKEASISGASVTLGETGSVSLGATGPVLGADPSAIKRGVPGTVQNSLQSPRDDGLPARRSHAESVLQEHCAIASHRCFGSAKRLQL